MPDMFVKRDDNGRIVAVSNSAEPDFREQVEPGDPDLQAFLDQAREVLKDDSDQFQQLRSSDVELARVVEDMINLLTDKGIIQFTELPEAAQKKLLQRKRLRQDIRHLDLVADDDSDQLVP